jgi:hypothetical protein
MDSDPKLELTLIKNHKKNLKKWQIHNYDIKNILTFSLKSTGMLQSAMKRPLKSLAL